ncbi:MAG: hypothetical protein ACE145_15685 [Terriglobia bacterium]
MKTIRRGKGLRYLVLDAEETTEQALKAIARASFETSELEDIERNRPVLVELGIETGRRSSSWNEKRMLPKLRTFNPRAAVGEALLVMDHVETVRCKTAVHRGRKYLRLFVHGGREKEVDMIVDLANYYMSQSPRV